MSRCLLLCSSVLLLAVSSPLVAADQYPIHYERNVAVKMRDGVTLRADIYRPKVDGKFPILLQRTPYNKDSGFQFGMQAAARGYVVIFEDVRGRYASEGEWYTFKNEPSDGYDTVEWAAALPYSDGRVGMFGGSYVGATQMLAAIAHPPHLAGICPVVTASNYHENWTYTGGAFAQWFNQDWTSGLAQNTYERLVGHQNDPVGGLWALPLTDYPILNLGKRPDLGSNASVAPYYLDWLAHPSYDDYWKSISIEEHFSDITVPACTSRPGMTFSSADHSRTLWESAIMAVARRLAKASNWWLSSVGMLDRCPRSAMSILVQTQRSRRMSGSSSGTTICSKA